MLALGKQALVLRNAGCLALWSELCEKHLAKAASRRKGARSGDQIGSPTSALYLADCIVRPSRLFGVGRFQACFMPAMKAQPAGLLAHALEKLAHARGFTAGAGGSHQYGRILRLAAARYRSTACFFGVGWSRLGTGAWWRSQLGTMRWLSAWRY